MSNDRTAREAAARALIAHGGSEGETADHFVEVMTPAINAAIDAYLAAMKGDEGVVERVAKAIWEPCSQTESPAMVVGFLKNAGITWEAANPRARSAYIRMARAALSAMLDAAPDPSEREDMEEMK